MLPRGLFNKELTFGCGAAIVASELPLAQYTSARGTFDVSVVCALFVLKCVL